MTRPFGVIFDFDGVVLDSETPEYEAHRQLFRVYGVDLTVEDWCSTIGTCDAPRRWFDRLVAAAPDLDFDTFLAEKRRLFRESVRMEPVRGIDVLLTALEAEGIPTAIASNATGGWVQRAVNEMGVTGRFHAIVTADDVERPKPAPDVYLEAARLIAARPSRCVAIEDSVTGVSAARAAGMRVVAIPHWLTRQHDLSAADLVVEHAGDLSVGVLRSLVLRD
jgi:HAD superfamily hydrolase (TIGR01509 family)